MFSQKRYVDPHVRRKLEELGEATVRAKLPWTMNVTSLDAASRGAGERLSKDLVAPLWAIEQWLAEKDSRRQRWVIAATVLAGAAAMIALVGLVISLLAWRFPVQGV